MKIHRRIVSFLALAFFSATVIAGSGYRYLGVDEVIQQHSNWCWAATSADVLRWYGMSPSQCQIVNWAYGRNDACYSAPFYWNSSANTPNAMFGSYGSLQHILSAWGIGSQVHGSSLGWYAVVNNVNAGQPFIMRFAWYNGGGHFLVGYGYYDLDGEPLIGYMNPWPGEGYTWSNYNWTVHAAWDHTWTHTLTTWN